AAVRRRLELLQGSASLRRRLRFLNPPWQLAAAAGHRPAHRAAFRGARWQYKMRPELMNHLPKPSSPEYFTLRDGGSLTPGFSPVGRRAFGSKLFQQFVTRRQAVETDQPRCRAPFQRAARARRNPPSRGEKTAHCWEAFA